MGLRRIEQGGKVLLVLSQQAGVELTLGAVAKWIEPAAAQTSQGVHDPERGHDPGAEFHLFHLAAHFVFSAKWPGSQVEMQCVVALEGTGELLAESVRAV